MFQKMLQDGGGGESFADFKSGYIMTEGTYYAEASEIFTDEGRFRTLGETDSSEYFNISNYWDITINKDCKALMIKMGNVDTVYEYVDFTAGQKLKGNYGGQGCVVILFL